MDTFPRRVLKPNTVLAYGFPKEMPIFWGPGQRILEDDKYVEPVGWKFNETLTPPFVVRFLHDSGIVESDLADGTAPGGGGGGDSHPWELYLIQISQFLSPTETFNTSGWGFSVFPCASNGSSITIPGAVGFPPQGQYIYPGGIQDAMHLLTRNVNGCEEFLAGNYIFDSAAGLIGRGYLRNLGYLVFFNWRKKSGPGPTDYDYYEASICGDTLPNSDTSLYLNSTPRTTPIFLNEFPYGFSPDAPPCPNGGP